MRKICTFLIFLLFIMSMPCFSEGFPHKKDDRYAMSVDEIIKMKKLKHDKMIKSIICGMVGVYLASAMGIIYASYKHDKKVKDNLVSLVDDVRNGHAKMYMDNSSQTFRITS